MIFVALGWLATTAYLTGHFYLAIKPDFNRNIYYGLNLFGGVGFVISSAAIASWQSVIINILGPHKFRCPKRRDETPTISGLSVVAYRARLPDRAYRFVLHEPELRGRGQYYGMGGHRTLCFGLLFIHRQSREALAISDL